MRLLSFLADGRESYGIARDDGVYDLGARLQPAVPDLKRYLQLAGAGVLGSAPEATSTDFRRGEFQYAPVIQRPDKILCVGHNYHEHRKETGREETLHPSIFTRFADTLVAHEMPIRLPTISSALDYEGELAVVIGRPGFRVPASAAASLVAGYTCFNDATLRDWQRHTHQFTPGKNFPCTAAFGPELVTVDELSSDRFRECRIETRLNGAIMQEAVLGDMIFPIATVIAYISSFTRLMPGDVIATGTPGGVGFRRNPQLFMKPGDTVEVTIQGVGQLRNGIVGEDARA